MKKLQNPYGSFYSSPKQIDDETYSIDVMCGANITGTVAEAISVARGLDVTLRFEFNGVTVSVRRDSNPDLIQRDWSRAQSGYIDQSVGPYPNPVLTDEEKESDARIEAENESRRQKHQAECEEEDAAHRVRVKAKLANSPAIEISDEAGWQKFKENNQDGYGGAVVTYAERWAQLMEVEMANGKNLKEVAKAASFEADLEGITGFMYGCAVSILASCWKHGDLLRRWHNLATQIRDEGEKANEDGGVLNPALLSIR